MKTISELNLHALSEDELCETSGGSALSEKVFYGLGYATGYVEGTMGAAYAYISVAGAYLFG